MDAQQVFKNARPQAASLRLCAAPRGGWLGLGRPGAQPVS